jgi:hypothetical protein
MLLLPLGIIVPIAMAIIALVPSYAGVFYATKIIYSTRDIDISPYALDVLYIFKVYIYLFEYWWQHITDVSFLEYTMPIIALPLIGFSISMVGAIIFVSFMATRFRSMV